VEKFKRKKRGVRWDEIGGERKRAEIKRRRESPKKGLIGD